MLQIMRVLGTKKCKENNTKLWTNEGHDCVPESIVCFVGGVKDCYGGG
jgi:hypothetical protein